jgi:hypothetical protein
MSATENLFDQIFAKYGSFLSTLGYDRVLGEEFRSAPGRGISCAYWVQRMAPAINQSGLSSTSCVLVFSTRLMSDMIASRDGQVDPKLTRAASLLFGRVIGGFTLDGLIKNVDVRGSAGYGALDAQAGWIKIDDKWYRIYTISVPMIVNDLWDEVA